MQNALAALPALKSLKARQQKVGEENGAIEKVSDSCHVTQQIVGRAENKTLVF